MVHEAASPSQSVSPTRTFKRKPESGGMATELGKMPCVRPELGAGAAATAAAIGSAPVTVNNATIESWASDGGGRSSGTCIQEMKDAFKSAADTKKAVANGQFLNLILHTSASGNGADLRKLKKLIILDALTHLVLDGCSYVQLPQIGQDALVSLYDSPDDLTHLALANLVTTGGLQLPKPLEQYVVAFMESVESGSATDEVQLLAASIVMSRAISAVPRELTTLLIHACGLLVKSHYNKDSSSLHLAALLCLRSYLGNARVVAGTLPNGMLTGADLVEKFCQKTVKHRPAPMSRECVSFLKAASSPLYANIIRNLFSGKNRESGENNAINNVLQTTAVKLPEDLLAVFARVYCISPENSIPIDLLAPLVENLIASRGLEVVIDVIRFAMSCSETCTLLKAFFGEDEDIESERSPKFTPLVEVYQKMKDENNPLIIWPAAALRFIGHPVVDEALVDGSLKTAIELALQRGSDDDRIAAMLLLCPEQRSPRLTIDDRPLMTEMSLAGTACINCAMMKAKVAASDATCDVMSRSLASAQLKLREHEQALDAMHGQVATGESDRLRRVAEAAVLQGQVALKDKLISELKTAGEEYENQLSEQRAKNEEMMTALKQVRRDLEKSRLECDRKRAECQNLQRELSLTKEQLAVAKKKIEDLEMFKERLSSLMGSFATK